MKLVLFLYMCIYALLFCSSNSSSFFHWFSSKFPEFIFGANIQEEVFLEARRGWYLRWYTSSLCLWWTAPCLAWPTCLQQTSNYSLNKYIRKLHLRQPVLSASFSFLCLLFSIVTLQGVCAKERAWLHPILAKSFLASELYPPIFCERPSLPIPLKIFLFLHQHRLLLGMPSFADVSFFQDQHL